MIEMAMTTWNCLWTLNLAPQAVNFYFTACLIFHQMCKKLLFCTCILSSDFQLTSPHDFHYFTCKLIIDKIYLLLFTCINILIRYLPVHCNCLINTYLGSRNTYWKTCHFNIGAIGVDFTLYYSMSIKYLKCAIKYSLNFIHVYGWLWPCVLLLSDIVKCTRLSFYFSGAFLLGILKLSHSSFRHQLYNFCFRSGYILDMIRPCARCMLILQVLSFQKLSSLPNVRGSIRPCHMLATEPMWIFFPCILGSAGYLFTHEFRNLSFYLFTETFQTSCHSIYFFNLLFHPNFKESFS